MDPQFRTSFIPKKPITAVASKPTSTVSLFALLSTVLFIVAVALSGGVFFYQGLIAKQIDADKASLDRARGAFDPDLINRIVRLDSRIENGKKLVSSHVAVTPLFDLLSRMTLPSVRFREFSFQYLAPDKIQVIMKGQAQSYTAVALESDTINGQKAFKNTVFSDMSLDPQGTVSFNAVTTIDQSLLTYSSTLFSAAAPAAPAASTSPSVKTQ